MAAQIINFLSADVPLGKSFWLDSQDELCKSSYPNVKNFTSHSENISSLRDFYTALKSHAAKGHCLIKGKLTKTLSNEGRAASTKSDDSTHWICLDLDRAPYASPQAFMAAHPALKDLSYIVQYSASYGIGAQQAEKSLSCHIFILIDNAVPAPMLKTWLMELNLSNPTTREALSLTRTGAALHWPVDITACQNDKLLYITPPSVGKGVKCWIKEAERIQYVVGKLPHITGKSIVPKRQLEALKEEERGLKNDLRIEQGLKPLRSSSKWVGEYEVQSKPGEAQITGIREDRGFVYFNLNGGDSWGYYHPVGNYELLHSFKGEPSYYTREIIPAYYKDCVAKQKAQQGQPTEGGETVLAFRDKRTATYWNGTWREDTKVLDLHPAKSELQLNHWMQNYGMAPFEVIPIWDMQFNPQSEVILDEENRVLNTYVPSPYFQGDFTHAGSLDNCPLIKRIMLHAVSGGVEDETFEHWLNWLAVIFQHKSKPKTAWLFSGTEGTGKGLMFNNILAPLLGREYVQCKRASELEEKFNAWMEKALIAFIDEVEIPTSTRKELISADLRNFITEDWVTIRGMNRGAAQVRSYTGIAMSTNKSAAVMISANDRRYNVGVHQPKRIVLSQEEIDEQIPRELEAFMCYLMTRTANKGVAAQALKNAAHAELVESNKTSIDVLVTQLADGDIMSLWDSVTDPNIAMALRAESAAFSFEYHKILKREITEMCLSQTSSYQDKVLKKIKTDVDKVVTHESRLSRDELMVVFEHCVGNMPKTPNKFTSMLKHRNVKTERLRINGTLQYGLRTEWKAPRSWVDERMAEFAITAPKSKLARVK